MGLLANGDEKTLTYTESKKYQRLFKKVSAIQLTQLFKTFFNFSNNEQNRLKYGVEQEMHLITSFPKQPSNGTSKTNTKEYVVSLEKAQFLKDVPKSVHDALYFMPEYAEWMIEFIPNEPFVDFLNSKEYYKHLEQVDVLNQNYKKSNGKYPYFLLSSTPFPKLGYADYYIRSNGERVPFEQRQKMNSASNSLYYIDETISRHVRFSTLTHNNMLKRGHRTEINVPIFVDTNTKIRFKDLYIETKDYSSITYKMEETIKADVKDNDLKNVTFEFHKILILRNYQMRFLIRTEPL